MSNCSGFIYSLIKKTLFPLLYLLHHHIYPIIKSMLTYYQNSFHSIHFSVFDQNHIFPKKICYLNIFPMDRFFMISNLTSRLCYLNISQKIHFSNHKIEFPVLIITMTKGNISPTIYNFLEVPLNYIAYPSIVNTSMSQERLINDNLMFIDIAQVVIIPQKLLLYLTYKIICFSNIVYLNDLHLAHSINISNLQDLVCCYISILAGI